MFISFMLIITCLTVNADIVRLEVFTWVRDWDLAVVSESFKWFYHFIFRPNKVVVGCVWICILMYKLSLLMKIQFVFRLKSTDGIKLINVFEEI